MNIFVVSCVFGLRQLIADITLQAFVEEVMELVELASLIGGLVGLPEVNGLSTEQHKRLTIAVKLVANPSIVFMDEPTSGLDARATPIMMRIIRNIVNTGRTIVCTIHQPIIDIFESFDELIFMKCGGELIYAGRLGSRSSELIKYIEECQRSSPEIIMLHGCLTLLHHSKKIAWVWILQKFT